MANIVPQGSIVDLERQKFVASVSTSGQNGVVVLNPDGTNVGGGTQYADGTATPAHPVGSALVYNNAGTLTAVGTTTPLPVQVEVGSVVIGKVDIDQATPGTTNGVSIAQIAATTVNTAAAGTILVGNADGAGTKITSTLLNTKQGLDVNLIGSTNITTGPAYNAPAAGAITANGQTVTLPVQAYTTVVIEIFGTYGTGSTLQFEQQSGSASTTYYPVFVQPITSTFAATPVSSVSPGANGSFMFQLTLGANVNFRVRASAWASPSGSISVFMAETTDTLQYGQTIGINNTIAANVSQINGNTIATAGINGTQAVGGIAANNATQSGNPLYAGGTAINAEASVATNGQNSGFVTDLAHKLIVMPYANKENLVKGSATTTGTSDVSVIASAGGSLRNYVAGGTVYNSGATTAVITLKDGSGGSTLGTTIAPAGGGSNFTFPTPVFGTAATAVYFAAGSSSTTVGITLVGYSGT